MGTADQESSDVAEATVAAQEVLEALLSKKNLVRDQALAGSMNPQMYIPMRVLLAHDKLQAIGASEEAVVAAARRSARLGIDESATMVRPLLKSKRNVIILRDVPPDATEAEIGELMAGAPHADKIKTIKPEVNNTWFVKFDLDDGTQDVVLWLRSQKIKGAQVNAAIKSEHFLRSFFPLHLPGGLGPMGYPMPAEFMDGAMAQDAGYELYALGGKGFDGKGFDPQMFAMKGKGLASEEWMQGAQKPGHWQPWGKRAPPTPLSFSSATELADPSVHATREAPVAFDAHVDPSVQDVGKGKWGGGKGWEKGSWDKGWDKGGWDKGWQRGGWDKGWQKGVWDKGDDGKGRSGSAKGWAGGKGWPQGGSKGDRQNRKLAYGGAVAEEDGSRVAVEGGAAPKEGRPVPSPSYQHTFRKYDRAAVEKICDFISERRLDPVDAIELLGAENQIFREAPSVELSPKN